VCAAGGMTFLADGVFNKLLKCHWWHVAGRT
jgi:hypothetical protein